MNIKYPFPAITVHDEQIRFNAQCEDFLRTCRRIQVSKAGPLVIFRSVSGSNGFAWSRRGGQRGGTIKSRAVLYTTGLRTGRDYKLFPHKDGMAANINEPLEV